MLDVNALEGSHRQTAEAVVATLDWLRCAAVASSVLWAQEAVKVTGRALARRRTDEVERGRDRGGSRHGELGSATTRA